MKTPEQILEECTGHAYGLTNHMHILAMKIYANQKLDQAANQAIIKDEENNDHWYECFPIPSVDKQSILSLKDSI